MKETRGCIPHPYILVSVFYIISYNPFVPHPSDLLYITGAYTYPKSDDELLEESREGADRHQDIIGMECIICHFSSFTVDQCRVQIFSLETWDARRRIAW